MPTPFSVTPDSAASFCFSITPADSLLQQPARALYIGGTGNVRIKDGAGGDVTFNNVAAGSILPVMATQVYSTNTTATNIIGLV